MQGVPMKRRRLINSCAATILMVGLTGAAQASHHSGGMSGIASVYSGGRTANGEHAAAGRMTAAHRSLPFATLVKVTNRRSQRSVVVRINDRGPFVGGRVIALPPAAPHAIGFSGLAPVSLSGVGRGGRHT